MNKLKIEQELQEQIKKVDFNNQFAINISNLNIDQFNLSIYIQKDKKKYIFSIKQIKSFKYIILFAIDKFVQIFKENFYFDQFQDYVNQKFKDQDNFVQGQYKAKYGLSEYEFLENELNSKLSFKNIINDIINNNKLKSYINISSQEDQQEKLISFIELKSKSIDSNIENLLQNTSDHAVSQMKDMQVNLLNEIQIMKKTNKYHICEVFKIINDKIQIDCFMRDKKKTLLIQFDYDLSNQKMIKTFQKDFIKWADDLGFITDEIIIEIKKCLEIN